jgi:hypothetical protein
MTLLARILGVADKRLSIDFLGLGWAQLPL